MHSPSKADGGPTEFIQLRARAVEKSPDPVAPKALNQEARVAELVRMATMSEFPRVNNGTPAVRRPPTHAEAISEFRDAATQHPEWDIDMEAVLTSIRYVRGESV